MTKKDDEKLKIPSKRYAGDSAVVSARLPKEMVREIDVIAKRTGHNRNEILSLCLEFALKRVEMDS